MELHAASGRGSGPWAVRLTAGFMAVFGCAFGGFGVYACQQGLAKEPDAWMPWIGGGAFAGFGALVVALAVFGLRRLYRQKARREALRDRPWMWRDDWASGRLESGTRAGAVGLWAVAAIWNAIAAPLAWKVGAEAARGETEPLAWGVLLFPLAGLGFVVAAVRQTLRWRRFGRSVLELETLPGVVGGRLRCVLHAGEALAEAPALRVALDCVRRRRTGSGKSSSTTEHILWQRQREVPRSAFAHAAGVHVPVEFTIPWGARESDDSDPRDRILWRLRVEASLPGVDYAERFEVPVFRTPESSEAVDGADEDLPEVVAAPAGGPALPGSGVRVRPWGAGGRELHFGMLRTPGLSALLLLFAACFGGGAWAIHAKQGPAILAGVFGLVALLVTWGALSTAFGVSRVRVEPGRLRLRRGLLGLGRTRSFPADRVSGVEAEQGVQQGNRVYYRLRLHRREGGAVTLGTRIADRLEAEALARVVREGLGLPEPTRSAEPAATPRSP